MANSFGVLRPPFWRSEALEITIFMNGFSVFVGLCSFEANGLFCTQNRLKYSYGTLWEGYANLGK